MSQLYKTYEKLENGQEIKMTISYDKQKGYRCTVVPVKTSQLGNGMVMEEFGAFTGFNDTLITNISRQSKKQLQAAIDELQVRKEMYMEQFKEGGRYAVK